MAKKYPGIDVRHSRSCASRGGAACNCDPSYRAWVWSPRDGQKIRKTFTNLSEAKGWRTDALSGLRKGTMRAPTQHTVREAWDAWITAARAGQILKLDGRPYKPSVLRTYSGDMERYLLPSLGAVRLSQLHRRDVQAIIGELSAAGLSGSKVRNAIMPLRVICRRALRNDEVVVNPTANLDLPAEAGRRERVASPAEAVKLLDALPEDDRALWATAFYAGLSRGERRALRVEDVDLDRNVISVRRGWDDAEGEIEPKSRKGQRVVPIAGVLNLYLREHLMRTGRRANPAALVFGRTATEPFTPTHMRKRARTAWAAAQLDPIGLHECRHTYVSLCTPLDGR